MDTDYRKSVFSWVAATFLLIHKYAGAAARISYPFNLDYLVDRGIDPERVGTYSTCP